MNVIYIQEPTITAQTTEGASYFNLVGGAICHDGDNPDRSDASDYVLYYMWKGSGELTADKKIYNLFPGDFYICRPGDNRSFVPNSSVQTEYYWFSFSGSSASEILTVIKFSTKEKYYIGHSNEITTLFDRVLDEAQKAEPNSPIIASSFFTAALGIMSRLAIHILPQDPTANQDKIAPAISSINSDCTSKLGVDEYAKMCNLSTSYFTHLFTKSTGYSPLEYKTRQRINIAKNLLATTNLPIKEISAITGFKDPLYFGRCFKRTTGQSPSDYREKK